MESKSIKNLITLSGFVAIVLVFALVACVQISTLSKQVTRLTSDVERLNKQVDIQSYLLSSTQIFYIEDGNEFEVILYDFTNNNLTEEDLRFGPNPILKIERFRQVSEFQYKVKFKIMTEATGTFSIRTSSNCTNFQLASKSSSEDSIRFEY